MKVAVSIPDHIFAEAELLAKGLKTSRSKVYARALDAFINNHAPDSVTHLMNEAVDAIGDAPGDASGNFSVKAASQRLTQVEW